MKTLQYIFKIKATNLPYVNSPFDLKDRLLSFKFQPSNQARALPKDLKLKKTQRM